MIAAPVPSGRVTVYVKVYGRKTHYRNVHYGNAGYVMLQFYDREAELAALKKIETLSRRTGF
jgi:hypothetical protein